MLLISIGATPSLSEVEHATKVIARLRSRKGRCPLTGQPTFAAALADVIRYDSLGTRAGWFTVERGGSNFDACLNYKNPDEPDVVKQSYFGKDKARESQLYTVTHLMLEWTELARFLRETSK
jgi:hypothetical protein